MRETGVPRSRIDELIDAAYDNLKLSKLIGPVGDCDSLDNVQPGSGFKIIRKIEA
jgi:hypothetical protein